MRVRLPQKAVLWERTGTDGFGRPKYAEPVEVSCRWVEGSQAVIAADGETVTASGSVFLLQTVPVGSYLYKGSLTEVVQAAGESLASVREQPKGREVLATTTTPNLKATQSLTTASVR